MRHVPIKRAQAPRLKQSALKQMISYARTQGENAGCVGSLLPLLIASSSIIHSRLACERTGELMDACMGRRVMDLKPLPVGCR